MHVAEDYCAVYLYWGRCGRVCQCRSLLGTLGYSIELQLPIGDIAVQYLDLHWGRYGREWCSRGDDQKLIDSVSEDRSLLGTFR